MKESSAIYCTKTIKGLQHYDITYKKVVHMLYIVVKVAFGCKRLGNYCFRRHREWISYKEVLVNGNLEYRSRKAAYTFSDDLC